MPTISQARIHAELVDILGNDFSFDVPFLEDVLNSHPFDSFIKWRCQQGFGVQELAPPDYEFNKDKRISYIAAGRQPGVACSKLAVAPLIVITDDKLAHMRAAIGVAETMAGREEFNKLPLDSDLKFAISETLSNAQCLRKARDCVGYAFTTLKERCKPLSDRLRTYQPATVAKVASKVDLGMLAALVVCTRWPDRDIVRCFILGFKVVGMMDESGALLPGGTVAESSVSEMNERAHKFAGAKASNLEQEDGAFILEACHKLQAAGLAGDFVTAEQLDREFGVGRWMFAPSFVHVQSTGKRRLISNAKRYLDRPICARPLGFATLQTLGWLQRFS